MSTEHVNKSIIVNSFTEESSKKFRAQVLSKYSMDPNMPITIYIDSYGGYLDSLNSMLATMRQVPNQFITVCIGKAMSCGAVLLAAGDYRFIDEGARVMIHQGSSGAIGPIESLQNSVTENKRINKKTMEFLLKRCNKTMKDFKQALRDKQIDDNDDARDLYLSAEDAKEFGIVDYIGMPIIQPRVTYDVDLAPHKQYPKTASTDGKSTSDNLELTKKKATKKKVAKKKTTKKKVAKKK